jgi:hypothetical protein
MTHESNRLEAQQAVLLHAMESFLNEPVHAADAWIKRSDGSADVSALLFGVSKHESLHDWATASESSTRPIGQGLAGLILARQGALIVQYNSVCF